MSDSPSLWELDPHTLGKHLVLKNYLNAWYPIMGSWNGRILFIDGFAGPGSYLGGEEGSPLIALRSFIDHNYRGDIDAEVSFVFIEKEKAYADHLEQLLDSWTEKLPKNCQTLVVQGLFDETMTDVLDQLDEQNENLAPAFVMVDPFGVSGTPMSVIQRILQNPNSEVYVSFMYEYINRFRNHPNYEAHLDQLFGTQDWHNGVNIEDGVERKSFFYGLYEDQLRKAGAKYVIYFELYRGNRLIYAIFFGTQDLTGCNKMKQAIWKVAPFGDFAFRASPKGQLALDLQTLDCEPLKEALREEFHGRTVGIKEVEDFVASDRTNYHTGQVRKGALIPMENAGEIVIEEGTRKRKRTYPRGTIIKFLED
jgi:three-Cys-motif partner protein